MSNLNKNSVPPEGYHLCKTIDWMYGKKAIIIPDLQCVSSLSGTVMDYLNYTPEQMKNELDDYTAPWQLTDLIPDLKLTECTVAYCDSFGCDKGILFFLNRIAPRQTEEVKAHILELRDAYSIFNNKLNEPFDNRIMPFGKVEDYCIHNRALKIMGYDAELSVWSGLNMIAENFNNRHCLRPYVKESYMVSGILRIQLHRRTTFLSARKYLRENNIPFAEGY